MAMDAQTLSSTRRDKVWLGADSGSFDVFAAQVARTTEAADWPLAAAIENNIPIYDGRTVRDHAADPDKRRMLTAEWVEAFDGGPGVIVIKAAMPDTGVVDRATELFEAVIDAQRDSNLGGGDHFAKPGANDRIWNAAEKHCIADPENFARYYASDAIALPAEAWLGAGYQVTAQVNRVNPGGAAQTPHRDYHLGFMTPEQIRAYPAHVHHISPVLTLQGAIAHCDMPVESGPTMLLPYSQSFFEGYIAFGRPEYQAYFVANHVQLPLEKGDAMFFNPALMHGAGANRTTDTHRMANLLQVSSAFGRAIESVNRARMTTALYPVLLDLHRKSDLSARDAANVIAACAEGYAFPTNLDTDPPVGGLAPESQAARMRDALANGMAPDEFVREIARLMERQQA
jgi:ectoine hydroxylase-related dioxygenase (phytanoyl-CoA dioxygenase family)